MPGCRKSFKRNQIPGKRMTQEAKKNNKTTTKNQQNAKRLTGSIKSATTTFQYFCLFCTFATLDSHVCSCIAKLISRCINCPMSLRPVRKVENIVFPYDSRVFSLISIGFQHFSYFHIMHAGVFPLLHSANIYSYFQTFSN